MFAINLEWNLTQLEWDEILIKTIIYKVSKNLPEADQLIFKSSTLSDNQQRIGTKWYLEMTSGKDYFIQFNLCLADLDKLAQLDVTYKLVFKLANYERATFEGNKIFDIENNWILSCPNQFSKSIFSFATSSSSYYLTFICQMQVQLVGGKYNTFTSIQTDYEKLLNDTKYNDFMLVTSTKKFNVHKSILAVRSEVFSAMFEHDMKEKKEGFAEIKEYDDEVVQEFLRYIYCGKVENLDKLAKNLLDAGEKYLIFDLKVLCLEEICKNIKVENAVELLTLVDKHNVKHLRSNVIDFIVQNIKKIGKSNLETIENVKLLSEILCKTLNL